MALALGSLRRAVSDSRRGALVALGGFVSVRALVLAYLFASADRTGRSGYAVLTKWDAQWYAGIAQHGYGFVRTTADGRVLADYAFFPLYPLTERVLAPLTGGSALAAGVLISAVAGVVAAAGIFAVADEVLGTRAATIATLLWGLVPVGVVESMAYSESLFTALAAWALFAVLRGRWSGAAVLACAAGLTRPSGIAVVAAVCVPVLIARYRPRSNGWLPGGPTRIRPAPLLPAVIAPLGILGYLAWVGWRRGSITGYFDVTDGWHNRFDGGIGFARWIGANLTGSAPWNGLLLIGGVVLLAAVVARCVQQRQPLALVIFTVVIVLLTVTTSGYFGSRPRYLLPAFPLLFPLAGWLAARRAIVVVATLTVASVATAAASTAWVLGSGPP